MVYSKIQSVASCLVTDTSDPPNIVLEPGYIIDNLPKLWLNLPYPVVVLVTDGKQRVEYSLDAFIAKTYKVKDKHVRIGPYQMLLSEMVVYVSVKVLLEDFSGIEDNELG